MGDLKKYYADRRKEYQELTSEVSTACGEDARRIENLRIYLKYLNKKVGGLMTEYADMKAWPQYEGMCRASELLNAVEASINGEPEDRRIFSAVPYGAVVD